MIQAVRNALSLPDLRRKILFTFFILFVYRAAAHVPVPGVNQEALRSFLEGGQAGSQLIGFLDLLSGGALSNFSVMAMGVYPYITATVARASSTAFRARRPGEVEPVYALADGAVGRAPSLWAGRLHPAVSRTKRTDQFRLQRRSIRHSGYDRDHDGRYRLRCMVRRTYLRAGHW